MLGRFEETVLALVYIKGSATVAQICEELADRKMPRTFARSTRYLIA